MHKFQAISNKKLNELNENYLADDTNRIIRNALCENDVATISKRLEAKADNPNFFSIDLKTLPVTNQMASGRCWLFSSLTLLREMVAKKYKIKDQFEFSQNYIAFYDKLEKINYFITDDPREEHVAEQGTLGQGSQPETLSVDRFGLIDRMSRSLQQGDCAAAIDHLRRCYMTDYMIRELFDR